MFPLGEDNEHQKYSGAMVFFWLRRKSSVELLYIQQTLRRFLTKPEREI